MDDFQQQVEKAFSDASKKMEFWTGGYLDIDHPIVKNEPLPVRWFDNPSLQATLTSELNFYAIQCCEQLNNDIASTTKEIKSKRIRDCDTTKYLYVVYYGKYNRLGYTKNEAVRKDSPYILYYPVGEK